MLFFNKLWARSTGYARCQTVPAEPPCLTMQNNSDARFARAGYLRRWARIEDELADQRQMIARNFLRFHPAFKYDIES